ncbi:Uu.00g054830.m01.CDS01 [Anthostomella pinea]|uniref:Uu.00g054830.m01.CDS01 n=1 Tax=Anthostomella pinea TaxID=933095 RepID=A0AAI8YPM2_9PEZI|nr:Uu.00g054830.m01.CDS01 [Anthostomella pinea]
MKSIWDAENHTAAALGSAQPQKRGFVQRVQTLFRQARAKLHRRHATWKKISSVPGDNTDAIMFDVLPHAPNTPSVAVTGPPSEGWDASVSNVPARFAPQDTASQACGVPDPTRTDNTPSQDDHVSPRPVQQRNRRSRWSLFGPESREEVVAEPRPRPRSVYVPTHAAADFCMNSLPDQRRWSVMSTNSLPEQRKRAAMCMNSLAEQRKRSGIYSPEFISEFNAVLESASDSGEGSASATRDTLEPLPEVRDPDEIEKTRRILESGHEPSSEQSPISPFLTRQRRRSYQLAVAPRIESDEISDFRRFLQQSTATDPVLGEQIWQSVSQGLGKRNGQIMPVLDGSTSNITSLRSRHSAAAGQYGSHSRAGRRQSQPSIGAHSTRGPRDGGASTESRRHYSWAIYEDLREARSTSSLAWGRPGANAEQRRSWRDDGNRHSAALDGMFMREADASSSPGLAADRRRRQQQRSSVSSFMHVIAEYIRPELPPTTDVAAQYHGSKRASLYGPPGRY